MCIQLVPVRMHQTAHSLTQHCIWLAACSRSKRAESINFLFKVHSVQKLFQLTREILTWFKQALSPSDSPSKSSLTFSVDWQLRKLSSSTGAAWEPGIWFGKLLLLTPNLQSLQRPCSWRNDWDINFPDWLKLECQPFARLIGRAKEYREGPCSWSH